LKYNAGFDKDKSGFFGEPALFQPISAFKLL